MSDNIDITPGSGATVRTIYRDGPETQVMLVDRSNGTDAENLGFTGTKTSTAAAPTGTASEILAANGTRKAAMIHNAGTETAWLGGADVTTATGIPLEPDATLTDDVTVDAWHAITDGGTGDLRIIEVA